MFSAIVPKNRNGSWSTMPILRRYSRNRERADILAIDQDRAVADVVEPADEVDQACSCPPRVGPTTPIISPGADRQVDVVEDRPVAVPEADPAELDLAVEPARMDGADRLGDARDPVEDLEEAMRARGRALASPGPSGSSTRAGRRTG